MIIMKKSLLTKYQNINIIQNDLRAGVHKKSNGRFIIGYQSNDQLKMIMR